jgi:acyl-CoA thioester hydrolase
MAFEFRLRVYYEDTDAGGIVYYANYLKFIERARTEALLSLGLSQTVLRERHGVLFVVREVQLRYLAPARLEDQLVVTTEVGPVGGARIEMVQAVLRDGRALVKCRVGLTCVGRAGRPAPVPDEVAAALGTLPPPTGDV